MEFVRKVPWLCPYCGALIIEEGAQYCPCPNCGEDPYSVADEVVDENDKLSSISPRKLREFALRMLNP